tara:strand:- start:509 stop:1978 length:1470 start_codon:yes stop_codon:yes gene_type:complete
MKESSDKDKGEKKVYTVNTFPVQFKLGEIKENLTININTLSKEKIINKALNFHSQGNISEAAKLYQYFINQGFKDHRVFSNYGIILKDLGQLKEAEILTRQAIEVNPDYSNSHYNLGIILKDLGQLKEAEISYRKAIEIKSDYAEAQYNLGNLLKDLGKLKEAEISTRKAVEIKPHYAKAHSNLGIILSDLGKLQELILLSKSTLESSSINQGYKFLALLRITISNLLLKNFSETLLSINKTNELINKGAINSIKDEKNRKNSFAYSRFITSLYPLLEKDNTHPDLKEIPHLGESHCLSFAHETLSISSQIKKIQPVLITGGKAWHFANNKNNQWKDSLIQQIKNHNSSDEIFISFGEIDCRKEEGILNYAIKNNKDISEVCKKTIKGFLGYMEQILSPSYSKKYYFGIPAPTRSKELLDDLDIKRIEMIKIYNSLLKQEVVFRGCYFLDVYNLTSTDNGENNNLYMCDQVHLSPRCLSILFKDHLYKT